jgi:vacuolar-type H+-ATPase subunit F/Vma7
MSHAVRVLCRPAVAPGFALTGMVVDQAEAGPEAAVSLATLLGRPDVGVVLIEDALFQALPEEIRRRADRSGIPVVVPFPSPAWEVGPAAEQYVVELLRRAIGYRVRLG